MLTSNIDKLTNDQLKAYLKRIRLNLEIANLRPDSMTLNTLHTHHTLHIPFENLEVHIRVSEQKGLIPLDISLKTVFDKIVIRNRGGYCYEMNKLFAAVLKTIGFEVYSHKAGVIWGFKEKMSPSHRMLTVILGKERFLVDVGFGGPGQVSALKILFNEEQHQGSHSYRLVKDEDDEIELQKKGAHGWKRLYAFETKKSYDENEYESNNSYISTNPDSIFVKQIICTRPLVNGRVSLVDDSFKKIEIHENVEHIIEQKDKLTIEEVLGILKNYFDIRLPENTRLDHKNKQHIFTISNTHHVPADIQIALQFQNNLDEISTHVKKTVRLSQNGHKHIDKILEPEPSNLRKFHFFNPT